MLSLFPNTLEQIHILKTRVIAEWLCIMEAPVKGLLVGVGVRVEWNWAVATQGPLCGACPLVCYCELSKSPRPTVLCPSHWCRSMERPGRVAYSGGCSNLAQALIVALLAPFVTWEGRGHPVQELEGHRHLGLLTPNWNCHVDMWSPETVILDL